MNTPKPESPGKVLPCKHLRSKEMFYADDPFGEDAFSSGLYWCACTEKPKGPDGKLVDRMECTPDRDCFTEY